MNKTIKNLSYKNRITDMLIVFACWFFAYYIRFILGIGGPAPNDLFSRYLGFGFLLSIVSIVVFKNTGIYENTQFSSVTKNIITLIKANFIAFFVFLAIAFFISQDRLSRILLIFYFVSSTFLLVYTKLIFRRLLFRLPVRLSLVGHGEGVIKYFEAIKSLSNFQVIDWFDAPEEYKSFSKEKKINSKELEAQDCDGVVIGYDTAASHKAKEYIEELSNSIIPMYILPDVQFAKLGFSIQSFKGIPVISINEPNVKTLGMVAKRVFDFFACFIGLILLSPLLILLAFLVKLTSKGPIFYGQVRMGVDGKEFKMWKFRSMVVGVANKEGWTVKNDPRVTTIGKFMRKTSLDELPQLWNVVTGDMSLVGPRPERPVFVNKFREEIPDYMLRHKFKAGITGWAQINGWRGDTSIEKRIECDIWYIKNWSFWLDISIIFLTFWKGFINKNAY